MTQDINITFLGTADAVPSRTRNHTAILLNYKDENILVDCGEGTQRQFRKAGLNPNKVTKILITHWHGDHVLGLPGLLQTMAFSGYGKDLEIYGPKGTKKFIREMLNVFVFVNKFSFKVFEIEKEGKFFESEDFVLNAKRVKHGIYCYAYNFEEKDKFRIDKKKLDKMKLPQGKWLKDLKEGKDVEVKGKKIKSKDITYLQEGRKISFVLDTKFEKKIIDFVKGSSVLICESSFSKELDDRAKDYNHLTAEEAGKIAKQGKVKELYLTHISQRYEMPKEKKKILAEAKKVFSSARLAEDLMKIEL